ncbi:MAG: S8 family serine peptidase [Candidatus Sumerlaeia bacterium]
MKHCAKHPETPAAALEDHPAGTRGRAMRSIAVRVTGLAAILGLLAATAMAQTIRLKSVEIDPGNMPAAKTAGIAQVQALAAGERRVEIVQWDTPVDQAKLDALTKQGAGLIQPLGDYGYMVSMPAGAQLSAAKAQGLPDWSSVMAPDWKFHPEVSKRLETAPAAETSDAATTATKRPAMRYRIQLVKTGGEGTVADALAKRGLSGRKTGDLDSMENWLVSADDEGIQALSRLNSVIWIEPFREPKLLSEREDLAIAGKFNADRSGVVAAGAYATWLNTVGLSGNNIIVHVMDDGLSKGNSTNRAGTAHPDILGRIVGIDNATSDKTGESGGGHGHLNASLIMGQPIAGGGLVDKDGYKLGQGVAPKAWVYATKIFNNFDQWDAYYKTETEMLSNASDAGAVISSNSWGASVGGEYDTESQLYDKMTRDANTRSGTQPMAFIFAASNDGPELNTLGSPATAKNVVSVGANENSDAGVLDQSGVGPALSNDMRDVAFFSSRGPTSDGRIAPTVVANGTHVAGGASDSSNFNGYGVSGRDSSALEPGEPLSNTRYYPANQYYYTRSSGTSHACPMVAGAAVLFYEFYQKTYGVAPSPAMVKAALVAGTVDPVGGLNNRNGERIPNIPNNEVGWGFATLAGIVDKTRALFVLDQATVLTASGQKWSQDIQVSDSSKPLRIVLTWTDVPAYAGLSKSLVNDLDLTVSDGKTSYKGNVFASGQSVEGGSADRLNNIECVFIPHPIPSVYTVTVTAMSISGDARPGVGGTLEQDFALIATNGSSQSNVGRVSFNNTRFTCTDTAEIGVSDSDLKGAGTISVTVTSQKTGDSETVALSEVKAPSGILRGSIGFDTATAVKNNGVLSVRDGDTIRATYKDATTGSGGTPLVSTADATLDCVAPDVADVTFDKITDETAEITIASDEAAQFTLIYGTAGNETAHQVSSLTVETSHKFKLTGLAGNTAYFFKVQLIDLAGNMRLAGDDGRYFGFQTPTRSYLLKDDMESGAGNWAHGASRGTDDWTLVSTTNYCKSPSHAWYVSEPATVKDAYLYTGPLTLPEGARLEFWHTYLFEHAGVSVGYDGGVLEITQDGGQTWDDLGDYMLEGGYNYLISWYFGNPLGGRYGWSGGSLGPMSRVQVDLGAFAGKSVRLRWRIGCDSSRAAYGWFIDDVAIYSLDDAAGQLAVLKYDDDYFTCAQDKVRFTIRDRQFSTNDEGLVPSDFYLAVPGRVEPFSIAPSTLNLTAASDLHDVWQGDLTVTAGSKTGHRLINGVLDVAEGESVRILYQDSKTGSSAVFVGDEVKLDCTKPALVAFDEKLITDTEAVFDMTVSEPSLITIKYGSLRTNLDKQFKTNQYVTSQQVTFGDLIACRPYYYRIELVDAAGNTANLDNLGEPFGFRTLVQSSTYDSLDPQPRSGWTHKAATGTDNWKYTISTGTWCSGYARSTPNAWNSASVATVNDNYLVMPPVTVTPIMQMSFWHTYELENGFDGARIEISTDNGANWKDLGANIVQGQYTGVISSSYNSPIASQSAWTGGVLGPMSQVVVELGKYAGSNRLIRFRHVCDNSGAKKGWIVDDIALVSYNVCGTQFPGATTILSPANATTGFPYTGGVLKWSSATGATSYEVFVGRTASTLQSMGEASATSFTISSVLKAGINYYWCVRALNTTGAGEPSPTWKFKTTTVDPTKVAKHIIGSGTLSTAEKSAVDYNDDGKVLVNELVQDINGK